MAPAPYSPIMSESTALQVVAAANLFLLPFPHLGTPRKGVSAGAIPKVWSIYWPTTLPQIKLEMRQTAWGEIRLHNTVCH